MAANSSTTRRSAPSTISRRNRSVADLAKRATENAAALRVLPKVLAETMEDIYGQKFRVDIDHETPLILIRLA